MRKSLVLLALASLAFAAASCASLHSVPVDDTGDEGVNIGYTKVRKKDLTASVGQVKVKDDVKGYSNIYEYLNGRVAGVTVVGTSIRIRGINSINSSNDPLIIVDGMPRTDISDLVPTDVKSIEVLKDAASTSIYGQRGANGVILITMKQAGDKL